jgi:hypothetical protein
MINYLKENFAKKLSRYSTKQEQTEQIFPIIVLLRHEITFVREKISFKKFMTFLVGGKTKQNKIQTFFSSELHNLQSKYSQVFAELNGLKLFQKTFFFFVFPKIELNSSRISQFVCLIGK